VHCIGPIKRPLRIILRISLSNGPSWDEVPKASVGCSDGGKPLPGAIGGLIGTGMSPYGFDRVMRAKIVTKEKSLFPSFLLPQFNRFANFISTVQ